MITKDTAAKIAYAYADIEAAETILTELAKAKEDRREPDFRDAFGRPARGLQLGVPSGSNSNRIYTLSFELAEIISPHISTRSVQKFPFCANWRRASLKEPRHDVSDYRTYLG